MYIPAISMQLSAKESDDKENPNVSKWDKVFGQLFMKGYSRIDENRRITSNKLLQKSLK